MSTSYFPNLWMLATEEIPPHTGGWFRDWATSERTLPQHHTGTTTNWCNEFSKEHFTVVTIQLLQGSGEHGKIRNSMNMSPMPPFTGCKMSCLVKSNMIWGRLGGSVGPDSSFQHTGAPCWVWRLLQILSPSPSALPCSHAWAHANKLINKTLKKKAMLYEIPEEWCYLKGFSVWALLLARWSFSSSGSQVGLGEWKSTLLNICTHNLHACHPGISFMSPLTNNRGRWGKRLESRGYTSHTWLLRSYSAAATLIGIHNERKR